MAHKSNLSTNRLLIEPIVLQDSDFIFELVNTEGWIKFIGDRNVKSTIDAYNYIQKILSNKDISYWTVKLKNNEVTIGIITFIRRSYLEYHDIGFAFLPKFFKSGFAYEATIKVLEYVIPEYKLSNILATTVPENVSSIKLLNKMGLKFLKQIEIENKSIHVYGVSSGKIIL